jgi:hypothetical protein
MFASIADNREAGIFPRWSSFMDSFYACFVSRKSAQEELEAKIYRRRIYAVQRILKPKSMLLTDGTRPRIS